MYLQAENNDESQNHNPTVEEYHDGLQDKVVQQYSRNTVQENQEN